MASKPSQASSYESKPGSKNKLATISGKKIDHITLNIRTPSYRKGVDIKTPGLAKANTTALGR
jgi:hypothetical protein